MNSRDSILNKLKRPKLQTHSSLPVGKSDIKTFCDYPDNISQLELFSKRFEALKGELHFVKNILSASERLDSILSDMNEKNCITFSSELIEKVLSNLNHQSFSIDKIDNRKIDSPILSQYTIGLTTADFLVARTGSIVLNSLNHGGRRISVLPPIHIVIAKTNQIINSLDDIFNSNLISEDWSYATIISGPSRTSDIEKQLVLGAHGPKRLIVILIENI